jgi:hypothetical protein
MASVVVSGDTSGAITLAAPAVAGTNTITLPATTGTMALTSDIPTGVTSLNGNTGALKGMTLLSTTSFTSASTIDITGIPTTAGTTYLLQIIGQTPNNGSLTITKFSLRYSTDNGSTFATTAIMSSSPSYEGASPDSNVTGYMGDVFWSYGINSYTNSVFANMFIRNGVSNGYPSAFSTNLSGDFENGAGYGRFYGPAISGEDTNGWMASGAGTVRNATFNALRIIRRSGGQVITGQAKLFVLGV